MLQPVENDIEPLREHTAPITCFLFACVEAGIKADVGGQWSDYYGRWLWFQQHLTCICDQIVTFSQIGLKASSSIVPVLRV
jgi:hypothetical protein